MQTAREVLERLSGITTSLATVRTLASLAKAIHEIIEHTVTAESTGIYMREFATNQLKLWHVTGFTPEEREDAERTAMDRHPGWVIRNKQMLHVPDTRLDTRSQSSKRSIEIRSRLWLPIVVDDEAIGAMAMSSARENAFSDQDISLLQFACSTAGFMYKNLHDNWSLAEQLTLVGHQKQELEALSSPLVEVWSGIIVLPIIGRVDAARAQLMTEKLLGIVASQSIRAVILDLTGASTIDAASVEHLSRMQRAVGLLGSQCVFTGISAKTASLITELGVDMGSWSTFATVRQALARLSKSQSTSR